MFPHSKGFQSVSKFQELVQIFCRLVVGILHLLSTSSPAKTWLFYTKQQIASISITWNRGKIGDIHAYIHPNIWNELVLTQETQAGTYSTEISLLRSLVASQQLPLQLFIQSLLLKYSIPRLFTLGDNCELKGEHKGFTKVKALGVIIVLLKQVQNHNISTTLTGQPQRLAGKIERDRCARQMINTRSYSPTYYLRSSCCNHWRWKLPENLETWMVTQRLNTSRLKYCEGPVLPSRNLTNPLKR